MILFSDLDGTLLMYPHECELAGTVDHSATDPNAGILKTPEGEEHKVIVFPPSSTGSVGMMTQTAHDLLSEVRTMDRIKLVYVTGARTSTLSNRLPFLPTGDAYVCENGGRIFYPGDPSKQVESFGDLVEDHGWRATHDPACGPSTEQGLEPGHRSGPLWCLYRRLLQEGWSLDANSYFTGFRVRTRGSKPLEEVDALRSSIQGGEIPEDPEALLTCTYNLALLDVYPRTSGKAQAARFLMGKWETAARHCCHMGDDDNDLELAGVVGRMFVSKPTSASVRESIAQNPSQFEVVNPGTAAPRVYPEGPFATEEMIRRARKYMAGLRTPSA